MRLFPALAVAVCAFGPSTVEAATYSYSGQTLNFRISGFDPNPCDDCTISGVNGVVHFNFDTSHFSGSYSLTAADSALFISPYVTPFQISYSFPETFQWFNPPDNTSGLASSLNGYFVFHNGQIVDWVISGSFVPVGCGGGPGCSFGASFSSTSGGDNFVQYAYPTSYYGFNDVPGSWSEQPVSPSVPEPSTWAMLFLGFCALGFLSRQRTSINFRLCRERL